MARQNIRQFLVTTLALLFGLSLAQTDLSTPGGSSVTLTFTSDPVGAEVYVADTFVGATPISVRINADTETTYRVLVQDSGYLPFESTVKLSRDEIVSVYVPRAATADISFSTTEGSFFLNRGLQARVGDTVYTIIDPAEELCLDLEDQRDFNGDGYTDALMTFIYACGGNAAGNYQFFVYWDGAGFHITDSFGYNWGGPTIERYGDTWAVSTVGTNAGFNTEDAETISQTHILKDGQAVLVSERYSVKLPTLVEIRSEELENLADDATQDLNYDLDEDGTADILRCRYWLRWGAVMCDVSFDRGETFVTSGLGCRRIGVLASLTNGVHDLVCGDEGVLTWQGDRYE